MDANKIIEISNKVKDLRIGIEILNRRLATQVISIKYQYLGDFKLDGLLITEVQEITSAIDSVLIKRKERLGKELQEIEANFVDKRNLEISETL